MLALILLAGLFQDDPDAIERRLRERREELDTIERRMQRALDDGRHDDAARLNREAQDAQDDLERLRAELEAARNRAPGTRLEWYHDVNLSTTALWTRFDSSLDLEDGAGWGAGVSFKNLLAFEYRRWETEDDLTGGDTAISQYLFSFVHNFRVDGAGDSVFGLGISTGLFHLGTRGPGGDGDTGWMIALSPEWGLYVNRLVRITAGVDIDLMRTHFNSPTTGTKTNVGLHAGIEIAF